MKHNKLLAVAAVAAALAPLGASATNGYFSHGYGMKSKGMAGVGVALPQDSLAASTNPAGMVLIGDRLDVGLDWFQPKRSTTLAFPGAPFNGEYSGNGDSSFFIPEFGYNKMISPKLSLGVSVYGNGGMNTKYTTLNVATGGGIFGQGDLGVDLSQLFIAPTLGYKIDDRNSVGVSLILAYQRFKAYGLTNFAFPPPFNASLYPANVTNNGYDDSFGAGERIGWIGQVTPELALGASYQSPIWMQSISKYKGLFANEGEFDIPMNATVGLAWKVMPKANLANGDGTFQSPQSGSAGDTPSAIASADFNGATKPDLAVANFDASISVLIGIGNGSFQAPVSYLVGSYPSAIVALDLNGDGKVDLAVTGQDSGDVGIFLGDGMGGFGEATRFRTQSTRYGVKIADLNGDGNQDLALTGQGQHPFSVMLGDGTGNFGAEIGFSTAGSASYSSATWRPGQDRYEGLYARTGYFCGFDTILLIDLVLLFHTLPPHVNRSRPSGITLFRYVPSQVPEGFVRGFPDQVPFSCE